MTLGRTLWIVILVKLFIIFAVMKLFFFPDFLKQHAEEGREADFVAKELTIRAVSPTPAGWEEDAGGTTTEPNNNNTNN